MSGQSIRRLIAVAVAALAWVPVIAAQPTQNEYRVFKPEGRGPHPGVVFVSGCSGFAPEMAPHSYEHSAERLRALGYFVVFADYLKRRGLQSCAAAVSMDAAGQDAVEAAAWLRGQSGIDAKRVSVIGWSFGGGAVLAALAHHTAEQIQFSRAVVYYPACLGARPWTTRIPLLILFAGEDSMTPRAWCDEVLQAKRDDIGIKPIVYPGAQHGFDMEGLPPKLAYGFGAIGHNPQAAAAAWTEVVAFLKARK